MLGISVLNFWDSGTKFICSDIIISWDLPVYLGLLSVCNLSRYIWAHFSFILRLLVKVQLSVPPQDVSGGMTTLQGCEQAVGQLLLPAATVLDRNSDFIIYLQPSLLPGPHIMLTLVAMFDFSLYFYIHQILLSWIPDVEYVLVPCVVLDECQKVATGISLTAMHPVPEKWYV